MKRLWYRGWHWLCAGIWFERISRLDAGRLSGVGPVLYIGLHRNGAVDGLVYRHVLPHCTFLISTQLRRNPLGRLFFDGIGIARTSDEGDQNRNVIALRECHDLLAAGGALFVFPEGTSSLGPRHLPFKSGAARIVLDHLATGRPLRIVPLGIHYERAWAFRSRVEVVVGEPVPTDLEPALGRFGRLREMKERMTCALEAVGVNFDSSAEQETAEFLSHAAVIGTSRSYFNTLKSFESAIPSGALARWRELEPEFARDGVWRHQGVPLFPAHSHSVTPYILTLAALGPLVLAGLIANLPPLAAAWLAGRKLADGPNVIALWRILVGVPVAVIWFVGMTAAIAMGIGSAAAGGYVVLTLLALKGFHPTGQLAVTVGNGILHGASGGKFRTFLQSLRLESSRE